MLKISKKIIFGFAVITVFGITEIIAQEGNVIVNQDDDITKLLALKKEVNKETANFKIQVYNGNRDGAEKARRDFAYAYGKWPISMEYETPNYKIWIGNFQTRLEADRALLEIKQKFPNAFIFKPSKKNKTP